MNISCNLSFKRKPQDPEKFYGETLNGGFFQLWVLFGWVEILLLAFSLDAGAGRRGRGGGWAGGWGWEDRGVGGQAGPAFGHHVKCWKTMEIMKQMQMIKHHEI